MKKAILGLLSFLAVAFVSCSEIGYKLIDVSEYTITFDAQGGTYCDFVNTLTGSVITLPSTSRIGYTFKGWFDSPQGVTKIGNGGSKYTVSKDVTMYAQWTQNGGQPTTYTVTFNANGGIVSPENVSQKSGTTINLPTPTRSGYTFDGWFSAATGGTKFDNPYTVTANNLTMYAQWTKNDADNYTVTFNANGGIVSPENVSQKSGTTINLPTPTRSGYTFDGWFSAATGGTPYGNAGDIYIITTTTTMYAQWTPVGTQTCITKFVDSESQWNLVIEQPIGNTIILPAADKSGYVFKGWSETETGDVKYYVGDSYTATGNKTFYAQWK